MFFEAASSRRPVIANSRATISTTIQAGIQFSPTKAIKAEQTIILSASGSIRIPKFVISLLRRAIWPSRKSVMPPATKSARAMVSWNRTRENITTRKATVRMNREIVSLLGRFIQLVASSGIGRAVTFQCATVLTRTRSLANWQLGGSRKRPPLLQRLTSKTPLDAKELLEAGLDEM